MPTVSVVIPTYRRPTLLTGAIASALAQTYTDLEVLVCDNDNDPAVARLVAGFADDRLRYLPRPVNLGMLRSAVEGFRAARGTFVVKLDDDDLLYPEFLARLVPPLLEDESIALAFGRFEFIDSNGVALPECTATSERHSGRAHLTPGRHAPATGIATRGAADLMCSVVRADRVDFDAVPDDVATAYDVHIVLQALRDGAGAYFCREVLAGYRRHPGADSNLALARQRLGALRVIQRAEAEGRHVDRAALRAAYRTSVLSTARVLLREGRVAEARRELQMARRRFPADPTITRLWAVACLPPAVAATGIRAQQAAHRRSRAWCQLREA